MGEEEATYQLEICAEAILSIRSGIRQTSGTCKEMETASDSKLAASIHAHAGTQWGGG